jgi:hypothetical protein
MKYIVFVEAKDYFEVDAESREEARHKAAQLAANFFRALEWDTEIVKEGEE